MSATGRLTAHVAMPDGALIEVPVRSLETRIKADVVGGAMRCWGWEIDMEVEGLKASAELIALDTPQTVRLTFYERDGQVIEYLYQGIWGPQVGPVHRKRGQPTRRTFSFQAETRTSVQSESKDPVTY